MEGGGKKSLGSISCLQSHPLSPVGTEALQDRVLRTGRGITFLWDLGVTRALKLDPKAL